MTITALAALCLLAPVHDSLRWPLVPGTQFAYNGINAGGTATTSHLNIAVKPPKAETADTAAVTFPVSSNEWKTLQIVFTYTNDGPIAQFGGIFLYAQSGHLWFIKGGNSIDLAPLAKDDLNDVQLLKHHDSLLAYVNGSRSVRSIIPTTPLLPVTIGIAPWKGSIIACASYARELSIDELYANERAAQSIAKALFADTPKVTVEGELTAITPVPELDRIRPYRSALLAEEYKLVRIVSGRMSAFKTGTKIRIFRYGIRAGEKTSVKDAKIGDHAEMLIQSYDSDPKFSREFQVDALDPDITIPLFVDVTPVK